MLDRNLVPGRFHEAKSEWQRSLSLAGLKVLVVCRGPVRMEAIDVFDQLGIAGYGMLLSEKDSIVYPRCLAPELRAFKHPNNVHRIPEYTGAGQEQKTRRIGEILKIAKQHGYTHIFAGYGFMAEDAEFIEAVERSGITFMGPSSQVANGAGAKDQAKKLARRLRVSVTPGVDNISALALLRKHKDVVALAKLAAAHGLGVDFKVDRSLEEHAEAMLHFGYGKLVELVTIEDLQAEAAIRCDEIWKENAGRRLRFKYIGGGGGKGQRVISGPKEVHAAVMDILAESKVIAPGANRNFLIELNVEVTRHNEIQLIGNGKWSLSLGGRDCSVQMHEQKLVEVSLTQEQLDFEIEEAKRDGDKTRLAVLEADKVTLARMEQEAERFGEAVGLDSVSTFESIVDGERNYFMEMNTRIQVEHRVTEQVYRLKFHNPADKNEIFYVDSLIEAMALLSLHGKKLDKPERVLRYRSGAEVRINATNAALQPHAGGVIVGWSQPIEGETRDDQGIGIPNPDTGAFVHYRLAGAYDSNIALVIADGLSRKNTLERLAEILRRTELRGYDLETNLLVHYGLLNWMLGRQPLVKPSTQFMSHYLAAVGSLAKVARDVSLEHAWERTVAACPDSDAREALALKKTLLLRPLERLLGNAHLLGGFIGRNDGRLFTIDAQGKSGFVGNPLAMLTELYLYLNLESRPHRAASEMIWDHDERILIDAGEFYAAVGKLVGSDDYAAAVRALSAEQSPSKDVDAEGWAACRAAHAGFQLGNELLLLIPAIAHEAQFDQVKVDAKLDPVFPALFSDPKTRAELQKVLAPAPLAASDEIVTPMGGHFYSREAPHLPPLATEGMHFTAGQPLFVIEVMKMFNKISVPFSGTITKVVLADSDGVAVHKGQPVFKIEPDERRVVETPEAIAQRAKALTAKLLARG